ncbi:MAG: beta-N-acetylhexosaminidase [Planctomycetota bacterium]
MVNFSKCVSSVLKTGAIFAVLVIASGCRAGLRPERSIDEKIGQMVMAGFRGCDVRDSPSLADDIRAGRIGGVVLFDYDVPTKTWKRNIESPGQLKKLCAELQKLNDVPLLIAVDQEGGRVARLKENMGFAPTVSAQYLGEKNDLALTNRHADKIARNLIDLGINLNLAPVVDLRVNPDNPVIAKAGRSFSADANVVTAHAMEFIEAHHKAGLLCTLKHFPGHGSSKDDSHLGMADVSDTWRPEELVPYRRIIAAGKADAVMTAHVFNAKLDEEYPATLSSKIIDGILRKQLGYDGVVISDDMQMGAIAEYFGFDKAVEVAIKAGVDIILIANNSVYDDKAARRTGELIKKLVESGEISTERINTSYRRIVKLKQRLSR